MKNQNLKTKVIGPALLLIPMACMHLGDDHHTGYGFCYNSVSSEPSLSEVISQDRMIPTLQSRADMGNIQRWSPEPF